jgi:hypothetical protein
MSLCDFEPTSESHPKSGALWRCIHEGCGNKCYGERPKTAICKAYLREVKVEPNPVESRPCQYRGKSLGIINCGCGSVNRETEVFTCELFAACTLTALGGKAGWLTIGLTNRPKCCRHCTAEMREDAVHGAG